MAYRADIEIAVKGGRELKTVSDQLGKLSVAINNVNKAAKLQGVIPASINNYRSAVEQANKSVLASAAGTKVQKQAIDLYVKSLYQAEQAEKKLSAAIAARQKELGLANKQTARAPASSGRLGGVVSNAVIGGAFPLLFGQGGGAATGGAIGGALGGLLGGTGGFAGSLLGTLLGGIAEQGNKIKEVAADIGFTAEQTKQLQQAFRLAGQEAEKFTDAVQNIRGLGLSIEEQANAIRLVSQLTETYGGKIDKVTNAFTSALESGKVTQATLNQLTSQGIPIQDALAAKYKVSRNAIVAMAKDGEISVQALADVLVDMGNKGIQAGEKPKTAFQQFNVALGNTVTAVTNVANTLYTVLAPAIDTIITKATLALNALTETINTELLRTQIQAQSGKVVSPARLKQIEKEARDMAADRYPSEAKGRQLAAGPGIMSPRAQQEFQILREQGIRNELQRFGYEQGILKTPKSTAVSDIGRITAPAQMPGGGKDKKKKERESQIPALQNELALQNRILEIVTDTGLARLAGNKATEAALQIEQILEERSAKIAGINLEKIPNAEKELKIKIATAEADQKLVEASFVRQNAVQDLRVEQEKQIAEILSGLDMELLKLQAKTDAEQQAIRFLEIENQLKADGKALTDQDAEAIRRKIAEVQKLTKEQQKAQDQAKLVEQQFANIGAGIGDMLTGAFDNLISKTKDWNDVLRESLMAIGKMLMMAGLNMLAGTDGQGVLSFLGFGSGFGKRAAGGPVTGGSPYLVGERGPELFVPGTGGTVVNNSNLRDAMGNAPGARNGPMLNMTFQTTNIGGVEYVSRDQLEAAMVATRKAAANDGAKRGTAATLSKLQNSPSTRAKLGLR